MIIEIFLKICYIVHAIHTYLRIGTLFSKMICMFLIKGQCPEIKRSSVTCCDNLYMCPELVLGRFLTRNTRRWIFMQYGLITFIYTKYENVKVPMKQKLSFSYLNELLKLLGVLLYLTSFLKYL